MRAALSNVTVIYRDAIAEHNTDRCYVSKSPGMEQFPDIKPHAVVGASRLRAINHFRVCTRVCNFGAFAGKGSI